MWVAQAILDPRLSFPSCKGSAILVGSVRELVLLNVVLLHLGSYSYQMHDSYQIHDFNRIAESVKYLPLFPVDCRP